MSSAQALADFGVPEIFNTDQGCQFTSEAFTGVLKSHDMAISRDGRGRALDNVFIERLWRSVKYEDVYLQGYETIPELILGLTRYFAFYNEERRHQSLDYLTPNEVYMKAIPTRAVETTATALWTGITLNSFKFGIDRGDHHTVWVRYSPVVRFIVSLLAPIEMILSFRAHFRLSVKR